MAKMSQYTPLDENDKEYFFGEGEGAVVTVGETSASSGKVNRLVKLSDIGGGAGGVPNAGKGIEYDESTNTLSFYYNGSGGFTTERNSSNHEMMKVKAGVGIEVDNKGVSIDTQHANEGDVLTYHKNGSTDEVVWEAPGGGGDSNIAFLEFTVVYNSSDEEYHLTAASMTPQEIISAIESGKSVFARCARMWNNTIESVVQIPFSRYYNEDAYYPDSGNYNIWFGGPVGSGGADAPYFCIANMGGGLSWSSSQWAVSDIDEQ